MPVLLALASACTYGIADFLGGFATRKAAVVAVLMASNMAGGLLAIALGLSINGSWSAGAIGWGAGAGLGGLLGVALLYEGLADGPNRLVSPLSAVVSAVVPIAVGVTVLGDRPDTAAVIGLVLAPFAVWFVAGGDISLGQGSKRPLLLGMGAGFGFGLSFALFAQAPDDAGAIPLMAARAVSLAILLIATAIVRPQTPAPSIIGLAVVVGVVDMAANALFLWSTLDGDLSIVGALVSLFPAPTVLLAVVFLGERLDRKQTVGLVLAIVTAGLLS